MIERKEGLVNQILYDNTVYQDGKYHFYPDVSGMFFIIEKMIESNETTKMLMFTPFYRTNEFQIEFEEMMFYLECRENVTPEQVKTFLEDCREGGETIDETQEKCCLCDIKDVETFQNALKKYVEYIKRKIPEITERIMKEYDIKTEELLCGYICFETHSD